MKALSRVLCAAATLATTGVAFAHPGHGAPIVHAHDLDGILAWAAAILVTAIAAVGVAAAARRRG